MKRQLEGNNKNCQQNVGWLADSYFLLSAACFSQTESKFLILFLRTRPIHTDDKEKSNI